MRHFKNSNHRVSDKMNCITLELMGERVQPNTKERSRNPKMVVKTVLTTSQTGDDERKKMKKKSRMHSHLTLAR